MRGLIWATIEPRNPEIRRRAREMDSGQTMIRASDRDRQVVVDRLRAAL